MTVEAAAATLVQVGSLMAATNSPGAAAKTGPGTTAGPGAPGGADPTPPVLPRSDGGAVKVTTKQAQRLHIIAGSKTDPGGPVDETTFRVLVFGCTNGRSDSASDLTVAEADNVEDRVRSARAGRLPEGYADAAARWASFDEDRHVNVGEADNHTQTVAEAAS